MTVPPTVFAVLEATLRDKLHRNTLPMILASIVSRMSVEKGKRIYFSKFQVLD
jgi:hypothetical protein